MVVRISSTPSMRHPMHILGKNKAIKTTRFKTFGNVRNGQTAPSSISLQAAKAGIITLTKHFHSFAKNIDLCVFK